MYLDTLIRLVNDLYDLGDSAAAEETISNNSNKVKIMFPTLDENMRPRPELVYRDKCRYGMNGECYKCPRYLGYQPNEEGTIFAYMQFNGWCFNGELEREKDDG